MSIEKTSAVVLSLMPYRESSVIATFFTPEHGRINCIAKGIKRRSKSTVPLERGFLVESIIYTKNGRDLHTVADIQISDYYPHIRADLHKIAIRDAAFELLVKSGIFCDPHPELFGLLKRYLDVLGMVTRNEECFILLCQFYFTVARVLGFGIHFDSCIVCGKSVLNGRGGFLIVESGGLECIDCSKRNSVPDTFIDNATLQSLTGTTACTLLSNKELIKLVRIAASYCRFHMEIRHEFKALEFIEQMTLSL